MKKILILLYLAFSQNVFCYVGNKKIQTELPKNEISVSYGVFSIYTFTSKIVSRMLKVHFYQRQAP